MPNVTPMRNSKGCVAIYGQRVISGQMHEISADGIPKANLELCVEAMRRNDVRRAAAALHLPVNVGMVVIRHCQIDGITSTELDNIHNAPIFGNAMDHSFVIADTLPTARLCFHAWEYTGHRIMPHDKTTCPVCGFSLSTTHVALTDGTDKCPRCNIVQFKNFTTLKIGAAGENIE